MSELLDKKSYQKNNRLLDTSFVRLLWGIITLVIIVAIILINTLHILPILVFTFWFNHKLYRNLGRIYTDLINPLFAFVLEYVCLTKYHTHLSPNAYKMLQDWRHRCEKNNYNQGKTILFCSNHRTRLDYLHLWPSIVRLDAIYSLFVISKASVLKLPIINMIMQYVGAYITRKSDTKSMQYLRGWVKMATSKITGSICTLQFFPEGTDLWSKAITNSNKYADKHGLPHYKYVLHPRTTGMCAVVDEIGDSLFGIFDCTLAYEDYVEGERCNELLLAQGRFARHVYVYIEAHTMQSICEQYEEHHANDDEDKDEDDMKHSDASAYLKVPCYMEKDIDELDMDDNTVFNDENRTLRNYAVKEWCLKAWQQREYRLKEFYVNKTWVKDVEYKIDYSYIPRSIYIKSLVCFFIQIVMFVWEWRNIRVYIWFVWGFHAVFAFCNILGNSVHTQAEKIRQQERDMKENV